MSLINKEEVSGIKSFQPVNGFVFVLIKDEDVRSKIGNIMMPPSSENDGKRGTVLKLSVSEYKDKDGNIVNIKVGDEVLFKKWSGIEINHEIKEKIVSVCFSDIFSVKEGEQS